VNNLFLGVEANTYFPHRVVNYNYPGVTITTQRFDWIYFRVIVLIPVY
jgi:outer membrane immunogenic protein